MIPLSQLKRTRLRLGLTQTSFAKQCGMSQSLITKIEAGKIDPKYSTVQRIEETIARLERATQPTLRDVVQRKMITAAPLERVPHLVKRMQAAGISQVPVLEGKHLTGLITESALLVAVAEGRALSELSVEEVMTEAPPTLPISTPLPAAAQVLEHVPIIVVTDRGSIAGIVTRSDLLRAKI